MAKEPAANCPTNSGNHGARDGFRHRWLYDWSSPWEFAAHALLGEVLHVQSEFQQIEILQTEYYGRCLVLDGEVQSYEADEHIYHESLVHPALLLHGDPRKVLVIGGGEGATLREVLRFLYLVAHHNSGKLTPARRVDLVWHEFILCTRAYQEFCEQQFGRMIHHHPGGSDQENRRQFAETLRRYRQCFGTPDPSYWGTGHVDAGDCGGCESF